MTITASMMGEAFEAMSVDISASVRPYKGALEQKTVTLRFNLAGMILRDVVTKSVSQGRISWANGQGRKHFAELVDRSMIELDLASPGAESADARFERQFKAKDAKGQAELIAKLQAQMDSLNEGENEDEVEDEDE